MGFRGVCKLPEIICRLWCVCVREQYVNFLAVQNAPQNVALPEYEPNKQVLGALRCQGLEWPCVLVEAQDRRCQPASFQFP